MLPPRSIGIDTTAASGILGSISIACWVVVYSPQIIKNFQRSSTDGLSLVFIVIWTLGDVFNVIGGVLQGVLTTMIILPIYYTLADVVLLVQFVYYRDSPPIDSAKAPLLEDREEEEGGGEEEEEDDDDDSPLLARNSSPIRYSAIDSEGRRPNGSPSSRHNGPNGAGPAARASNQREASPRLRTSTLKPVWWQFFFNTVAVLVVCAAGTLGWWLSTQTYRGGKSPSGSDSILATALEKPRPEVEVRFHTLGQVFGYLCAVFYLGSRFPQIFLNYKRKSTEGISMLFFLFACVGNLTYVLSIFAYEPPCARFAGDPTIVDDGCGRGEWGAQYGRYILVNLSWLIGSIGTLILDAVIFVQFWLYRDSLPATAV